MQITWSNARSCGRTAWLLLIKEEQIVAFKGNDIPGTVVVLEKEEIPTTEPFTYPRTVYQIELGDGVRVIAGHDDPQTGWFLDGLRSAVGTAVRLMTWAVVAQALGVSVPAAMAFLREWRPGAAKLLDEAAEAAAALAQVATQWVAELVTQKPTYTWGGVLGWRVATRTHDSYQGMSRDSDCMAGGHAIYRAAHVVRAGCGPRYDDRDVFLWSSIMKGVFERRCVSAADAAELAKLVREGLTAAGEKMWGEEEGGLPPWPPL